MKTVWVNLLSVIRKFRLAASLNIAGFAVAFAAFIIIMMQLYYEYTFDDYHPNASRIYRVEKTYEGGSSHIHTRPFIDEVIRSSPYIAAGTIITPYTPDYYFTVDDRQESTTYKEPYKRIYPDITKMFHFDMVEGDMECLKTPDRALIPESLARKLFGDQPATGQLLPGIHQEMLTDNDIKSIEVGGVYKDFPRNTQTDNLIYFNIGDENIDSRINSNYTAYVMLSEGVKPQDVIDNFNANSETAKDEKIGLGLIPLKDLYFLDYAGSEAIHKSGNREVSNILLLIAFLVLVIATVNYINFSTSIAPMRIRSINTQKVLGASERILKSMLLMESFAISMISFLLSLVIVHVFNRTGYITFVDTDLSLTANMPVLTLTAVIAIGIGLISGLYPAHYIMKYPPAMVLKGSFGLSPTGKRMRTGLVGFQFVISFALIIAAFFVYAQNRYMLNFNTGYDTEQIAVIFAGPKSMQHKDRYVNMLKANPDIEDVAFSMFKMGGTDTYMEWGGMKYLEEDVFSIILPVSWNFPEVMGIGYEGRKLNESFESDGKAYLIPNKKLKERYGMLQDSRMEVAWQPDKVYSIPGFINNINPKSLKHGTENICLLVGGEGYKMYSYIKIRAGANMHNVVWHIQSTVKELDPVFPFELEFFDTFHDRMYRKELNTSKMIFLFSMLAVILSVVGVFALVIFETEYRIKEIGIRKVHGASVGGVLWMFNRHYLVILTICFVIATPFAWYGVSEWLKGFAYKTPMYWWIYLAAFLIISFITFFTVTYQSWKAAVRNPTDSIKTE